MPPVGRPDDGPCPLCAEQAGGPRMVVTVQLLPTAVRTGYWCPRCLLPSGVEVELTAACEHGWFTGSRGGMGCMRWCPDCGSRLRDT